MKDPLFITLVIEDIMVNYKLKLYLLNLKLELIDFTSFFSASVVLDLVPAGEAWPALPEH